MLKIKFWISTSLVHVSLIPNLVFIQQMVLEIIWENENALKSCFLFWVFLQNSLKSLFFIWRETKNPLKSNPVFEFLHGDTSSPELACVVEHMILDATLMPFKVLLWYDENNVFILTNKRSVKLTWRPSICLWPLLRTFPDYFQNYLSYKLRIWQKWYSQ